MAATEVTAPPHPYYPVGIALSGDLFIANAWSVPSLVQTFAAGLAVILLATFWIARNVNSSLSSSDRVLVLWFVLSKSVRS
jgi:cholestenol delta-isomerase